MLRLTVARVRPCKEHFARSLLSAAPASPAALAALSSGSCASLTSSCGWLACSRRGCGRSLRSGRGGTASLSSWRLREREESANGDDKRDNRKL